MRLGEILIQRKLITEEDLERALELQKERGDKIGKTLVDMGFIAMRDVLAALSEQLEVPLVSIDSPPLVSPETEALSPRFLRQFRCLPMSRDDHTITLAMADPLDVETDRSRAPLHRAQNQHRARARAGDRGRDRQILRRIGRARGSGFRVPGRRNVGGSRTPARHGERSAGHPPGERDHRVGGGEARQRHPPGAVRKRVSHPLSRGWRAATIRTRRRAS